MWCLDSTSISASCVVLVLCTTTLAVGRVPGPQVTVFDAATLERLATVSGPHISNAFVSVSFSSDGSMLLAAGTDDSHAMSIFHLWEWRTSPQPKCSGIHDARDPVLSVLLDPRFDNNVLVMCAHDVGLWRQGSNGFKRHPVQGLDLPVGVEGCVFGCGRGSAPRAGGWACRWAEAGGSFG